MLSYFSNMSLTVPRQESSMAPEGVATNVDTDPSAPAQRTWGHGTMITSMGLDWRNAIGAVMMGCLMLITPMLANGKIGSVNRIPFPVAIRSSHGYWFAVFPILSRAIIALFWFGIQTWNGQGCMTLMLTAIWPSFAHLKNTMPASAGFTSKQMVAYFLFSALQAPLLFIHPSRLQPLFVFKAVTVPICAFAILGWSVHTAKAMGGTGELLSAGPTAHGEAFSSAWLRSMTALIGGFSTLALNIPDFTRYAKSTRAVYVQAPLIPGIYLLLALCSVITASCTKVIAGKVLWSPVDVIGLWESRAAVFFAAFVWAVAQISTNISTNSISAANDLATLFPRYINIRRGQVIVALVGGWCMVPWKILASATTFYNFISGYAIVLGPFAGLMASDYYFIKRQRLDVPALYDPHGAYRFVGGTNWRAVVALVVSIAPNIPGLAHAVKPSVHIGGASWIYAVSWLYGIVSASIVYTALSLAFPDKTGSLVAVAVHPDDYLAKKAARSSGVHGSSTPDSVSEKGGKEGSARSEVLPVV